MNLSDLIKRNSKRLMFVFDPGGVFFYYRDSSYIPLKLAVILHIVAFLILALFAVAIVSFVI